MSQPASPRSVAPLDIVRIAVLLAMLVSYALWGLFAWPFPWNIVVAVAAPALALAVWALFVSPRAVLRVHPFIRVLIELLLFVGVTLAWWSLDLAWLGIAFAAIAVASGVLVGRRGLD